MKKLIILLVLTFFGTVSNAKSNFEFYYPNSANAGKNIPLVVLLHGCTQTAKDMLELSRIKDLAEKEKFAVLLPEQPPQRNRIRCWNWFLPKSQSRFGIDPMEIMSLVLQTLTSHSIDRKRVYVAGLSAGGAMAGILAATWSDLFKAVAIHSSVSYKRAATEMEAVELLKNGPDLSKEVPTCSFSALPLLVIHGGADKAVNPKNAEAILQDLGGCDPDSKKLYFEEGLDHAWSGGDENQKYSYPQGADATKMIWDFFKNY